MPLETNTELPKDLKLTKEFLEAFKVMNETSKNVFITGNAGTGKSTLLEYFREKTKKNTAIVAHQGITALKAKGQTIHSFFKFPIHFVTKKDIKMLTDLGVQKVIPEWVNLRQQVMNCGILKFNNIQFKNIYLDRWKTLHKFCIEHQDKLNLKKCTAIAAQYLLTILCNHYKAKRYNYSDTLRLSNSYYVHYAGSAKFEGNISAMKEMTTI